MSFSEQLRLICDIEEWSLKQFSDKTGVPYDSIRSYSSGRKNPGYEVLLKISNTPGLEKYRDKLLPRDFSEGPFETNFRTVLAYICGKEKWNARDISLMSGVPYEAISDYLTGNRIPTARHIHELSSTPELQHYSHLIDATDTETGITQGTYLDDLGRGYLQAVEDNLPLYAQLLLGEITSEKPERPAGPRSAQVHKPGGFSGEE
ncbi:helix-turn-helix transcriptional regulator [Thalassolituus sp.]|uniref:helix-turn-helix domain-containing protein n=1 Tax=Thalassolituus sp. TaxID=2030822 RepID=UPI002636C23D|nr:helix-turn-helix transcriptional regulator [Thalassolituus sp.]